MFRFSVPVASKKDLSYTVVEERTQGAADHADQQQPTIRSASS